MVVKKMPAAVLAGAVALCLGSNMAFAQSPDAVPFGSRLYTSHTLPVGACPALEWHIVATPDNMLSGFISSNNMKTMFRVSGKYNPTDRTFRLDGKEVGGPRTGAVNGQVRPNDGYMVATLGGLPVGSACQGKTVYIPWVNYTTASSG
jgi:hypothetical protein